MKPGGIITVIAGAAVLAWLLWPLGSKRYAIRYDEAGAAATQAFLNTPGVLPDSIKPPNIVILLADDLGFHDLSLNGNDVIDTYHIDRLAQGGINCTRGYVTSSVCAPSRAGLITGRYQQRFGFVNQIGERYPRNRLENYVATYLLNSDPWNIQLMKGTPRKKDKHDQGLPPAEITLAALLKKYGYATGAIGKWHLGSNKLAKPCNRGFDYHYGFYSSHSLYAPEHSKDIVDFRNTADWTDQHIWKGRRNGDCAIVRNDTIVKECCYLTHRLEEEAVGFIERNKSRPFFLYVPFSAPHTPYQAPKDYYDEFSHVDDPAKRIYLAMVAALDDAVGAIDETIDRLGLAENTLIFFLSDNGAAAYTHAVDNAPLKGGKVTSFEGGLRIPFIVKWKGHLPAGMEYHQNVSSLDIFATAAAAAGIPLPPDRVYDGVNLLPFLKGTTKEIPHQALYWKSGANNIILANGWKLLFDDKWGQEMLYHLDQDPFETTNLTRQFPERVIELKARHKSWSDNFPPALWPPLVTFSYTDSAGVYKFEI